MTPGDAGWVGAWWLGYLIGAALCLLPVIPMLGFPREFPDTDAVRQKKRELEDSVKVIIADQLLDGLSWLWVGRFLAVKINYNTYYNLNVSDRRHGCLPGPPWGWADI